MLPRWNKTLGEVHDVEIAESTLINSVAPSMLLARLFPLLSPRASRTEDQGQSHVVLVTSNEGWVFILSCQWVRTAAVQTKRSEHEQATELGKGTVVLFRSLIIILCYL